MVLKCTSCGINVLSKKNWVKMKCPNCGEVEIIRCYNCKINSNKYICSNPDCKFEGP